MRNNLEKNNQEELKMKKLFAILLAALMLFSCAVMISADAADPAADGWEADIDFEGWNYTTEGVFTVSYFDTNALNGDAAKIHKSLITDKNTFTIEVDVIAGGTYTSPYVKVLGVELELDGNNGDGNQVFLKLDHRMLDWYGCTGNELHVTIWRQDGGDLNFLIEGKDGSPVPLSYEVLDEDADTIELGLYRGDATFGGVTCENGVAPDASEGPDIGGDDTGDDTGDDLPPIVEPTDPPETQPQPTETEPTESKPAPTEPKADAPTNQPEKESDPTLWIILGAVAVVAVVVVIVVVKRRGAK